MRPVQLADIEAASRVLLLLPQDARSDIIRIIIAHADIADHYRKRIGRAHPKFGSGTLMSAAVAFPAAPRPPRCYADYLACLQLVVMHLSEPKIDQLA
ncbi:DUF7742 family protein [Loktanella agnita]